MHGRIPRLVLVAPIVAALALTVMASRPAALGGAETPALKSISSRLDGAVSTVLIEASEPVAYLTSQPDPLTVLVDLRNVNAAGARRQADRRHAGAGRAASASSARPRPTARRSRACACGSIAPPGIACAARATRSWSRSIASGRDASRLPGRDAAPTIAPPCRRGDARADAGAGRRRRSREKRAAATELRSVRFAKIDDGYSVTLAGNGPLLAAKVEEAKDLPPRVLLDFHGVAAGSAPAVTNVKNDDIDRDSRRDQQPRAADHPRRDRSRAQAAVHGGADRRRPARDVQPRGRCGRGRHAPRLPPTPRRADVADAATGRAETAAPRRRRAGAPAAPVAPVAPRRADARRSVAPPRCRRARPTISQAPLPVPMPSSLTAAAAAAALPARCSSRPTRQGQRQFTGDPVTLDFQGADLRAVLRTFAEISNGLNIIIDPSIQGTVDVSLRDVPWDQALDIILRANKLGYSVEGNIVRIVPLNVLAQENEERRKLTRSAGAGRRAAHADRAGQLREGRRPGGGDHAQHAVGARRRAGRHPHQHADHPRPRGSHHRRRGPGADARSPAAAGRDRSAHRAAQSQRRARARHPVGLQRQHRSAVRHQHRPGVPEQRRPDAPATGAVNPANQSAIGLALGSINGALNLDVNLRAIEAEGKGRILSTPRVATQNNVEAEITQGSQIPIQTVVEQHRHGAPSRTPR